MAISNCAITMEWWVVAYGLVYLMDCDIFQRDEIETQYSIILRLRRMSEVN